VTRSTSYTPLDGNADQVEGLPTRTLKTKPSFSSFVEQDEELDYRNQDQEQDVGVEETVIKKKKTSRKSNKKEVDLGLGAEIGTREAEEEEEREREQGWEKVRQAQACFISKDTYWGTDFSQNPIDPFPIQALADLV
jgi:hypothetical protein